MTTLTISPKTYLVRVAIVLWVISMHLAALKMADTTDGERNIAPLKLAAPSIQVVFVQPLPATGTTKTVASAAEERHLPTTTPEPLKTHRAITPIQRPNKNPMEQIDTLADSQNARQVETKATLPAESKDVIEESSSVKTVPLNLSLPRTSTNSRMDEQRILTVRSIKKSESQVFSDNVERAQRPDCRSGYAGAGLLAIPRLLTDSISGDGCKW